VIAGLSCGSLAVVSAASWELPPSHNSSARAGVAVDARRIGAPLPPTRSLIDTGTETGSYNWAGYAQVASPGTYTAVEGTFEVPTVDTSSKGMQYSADWVGIGGYNDSSLVQAGIEANNRKGTAAYSAWTEILPAGPIGIATVKIKPGDSITVSIIEITANHWTLTLTDNSSGRSATRKVHYKSSGASAEAILERPCFSPCSKLADLANLARTPPEVFRPVKMAKSSPSTSPNFQPLLSAHAGATLYNISMTNNGGNVIAAPSKANREFNGFTVADGSAAPSPPS
jgi:hypothetical protein